MMTLGGSQKPVKKMAILKNVIDLIVLKVWDNLWLVRAVVNQTEALGFQSSFNNDMGMQFMPMSHGLIRPYRTSWCQGVGPRAGFPGESRKQFGGLLLRSSAWQDHGRATTELIGSIEAFSVSLIGDLIFSQHHVLSYVQDSAEPCFHFQGLIVGFQAKPITSSQIAPGSISGMGARALPIVMLDTSALLLHIARSQEHGISEGAVRLVCPCVP